MRIIVLLVMSFVIGASSSFAAVKKAMIHVILNDGTTVEGRYQRETKKDIKLKVEKKYKTLKKADIKKIYYIQESTIDRFAIKRRPSDMMLLYARHARLMNYSQCEKIVEKINKAEDPIAAAVKYIEKHKLIPEYIEKVVNNNRDQFIAKHGKRAREVKNPNYYILGTCDKKFLLRASQRMTAIFKEFQKQLNFAEKISCKFVIKVYSSQNEYYANGALSHSRAYYSPSKMELVTYYNGKDDETCESLYHEGMHQFLHYYIPNPPMWFNEGLAQYFDTAIPRGRGFKIGVPKAYRARNLREAHQKTKKWPQVENVIKMKRSEFYDDNPDIKSQNYAAAWVLTHFLIKGKNATAKQLFIDYFFLLKEGKTQEEANKVIFGKFNMKVLQKAYEKHILRL